MFLNIVAIGSLVVAIIVFAFLFRVIRYEYFSPMAITRDLVRRLYGGDPLCAFSKNGGEKTTQSVHIGYMLGPLAADGRPEDTAVFEWHSAEEANEYFSVGNWDYKSACLIRITAQHLNAQVETKYFIGWVNKESKQKHLWYLIHRIKTEENGNFWKLYDREEKYTIVEERDPEKTFVKILGIITKFSSVESLTRFTVSSRCVPILTDTRKAFRSAQIEAVRTALGLGSDLVKNGWNPDIMELVG